MFKDTTQNTHISVLEYHFTIYIDVYRYTSTKLQNPFRRFTFPQNAKQTNYKYRKFANQNLVLKKRNICGTYFVPKLAGQMNLKSIIFRPKLNLAHFLTLAFDLQYLTR